MGKFIDLTGMKFNKLLVIKRVENHNNRVMWLCQCDCNNHTMCIVEGSSLKNGNTKSCGCAHIEALKNSIKNNKYDLTKEYGIGYTSDNFIFYFDLEDYDKIKDYCWRTDGKGYIMARIRGGNGKKIRMHQLILPCSSEFEIDHINHKREDNRKANLRIVTHYENMNNRKETGIKSKSGYKWIYWAQKNNKWMVSIRKNNKTIYLGYYKNIEDAKRVLREYLNKNPQLVYSLDNTAQV